MRFLLFWPVFALMLVSGCDSAAVTGGLEVLRIEHQGATRTAHLFIPSSVTDGVNVPVVVALHGAGGSGPLFREQTSLDQQALDDGFVVVYPTATGQNWAEGCDCVRPDLDGVDDVGFADAVIEAVADKVEIDRRRIFALGYSQGAVFLHHLACQRQDTYAGFASVAGMMSAPVAAECPVEAPVRMFMANGSADTVLPFAGQDAGSQSLLSVLETTERWRVHNGCGFAADRTSERHGDVRMDVRRYTACPDGSGVALFEMLDTGHEWPAESVGLEALISDFFGLLAVE